MNSNLPSNIREINGHYVIMEGQGGTHQNSIEKKGCSTASFAKNLFLSIRDFFQEIGKIFHGEGQLIGTSYTCENEITCEITIVEDFKDSWATKCRRFIQSFNPFGASEAVEYLDETRDNLSNDPIDMDIAPTPFAAKAKNLWNHLKA